MKDVAPAAERNKLPIRAALAELLPRSGLVLEIASGTGQHAAHFAAAFPALDWQPSDAAAHALASVRAYRAEAALPNLREPVLLDVTAEPWPIARADAVVCINMIHIAPWRCCLGLLRGAAAVLPPGGLLYLYGPFRVDGVLAPDSNVSFDARLRAEDPAWGVRELRDVQAEAAARGLAFERTIAMPANNLSVAFRRATG